MKLLEKVQGKIGNLPLAEQEKFLELLEEYQEAKDKEEARSSFLCFVKKMWPAFIGGRHHEIMSGS